MAIREIPPEVREMEKGQVLVDNCRSCIELCKTGSFSADTNFARISDQKENLAETFSTMLGQLGTVVGQIGPEIPLPVRRPLKESGNVEEKSFPILRSLLRRNRKKSEKSGLIQKKKSFRIRTKSTGSGPGNGPEIVPREEKIGQICVLVQNLCSNIARMVATCFCPVSGFPENTGSKISGLTAVFENTWAGVFRFEADFYALQTGEKINPIIPKGMSAPTGSDVISLIKRLTGIFEKFLKILPEVESAAPENAESDPRRNLAECNRYLRELIPILKSTFLQNADGA